MRSQIGARRKRGKGPREMEGPLTMFTLISLIVIGALMLICFGCALVVKDPEGRMAGAGLGFIFLVIGAFIFIGNSAKLVGANEVGVKVTFGAVDNTTLQPGFHWVKPWSEVETFPTRPKTFNTTAVVRTSENGLITTKLSARWATSKENAASLYGQVRSGDDKKIEDELIKPNLNAAAGDFLGDKVNLDVINGKNWRPNADGIEKVVADYLDKYGVEIDTVRITGTDPDDATDANIKRASAQVVETNIADQAKATALKQAERNKIEAQGLKDAAALTANLTPTQIQVLCLQAQVAAMNKNFEKGITTYVLPCQTAAASVVASAK